MFSQLEAKYQSIYDIRTIKGKQVFIFKDHNMALPIWGIYSSNINAPCSIITFDSHNDTVNPFSFFISTDPMKGMLSQCSNTYIPEGKRGNKVNLPSIMLLLKDKHYRRRDFDLDDVMELCVDNIKNVEHIKTAYDWEYINSYHIISRSDKSDDYMDQDKKMGYDAEYLSVQQWYEQSKQKLFEVSKPYILDIDLDFFIDSLSYGNEFQQCISSLIKGAELITIAKEPDWFKKEKKDEMLEVDDVLKEILRIIEFSLS